MENEKLSQAKVKELAKNAPTSGNVEIRLRDPKRTGTITLRGYKDKTGSYRPYVDEHGQHRVLRIKRTLYLNMENMNDRLTLEQVKNHPHYISGSHRVLSIVDHNTEAQDFVLKKDLSSEADAIISKLNGEELKDFARILLISVKPGSSDSVIKRLLYEKSSLEPKTILDEWKDPNRELKSLVRKGIEQGVFILRQGRYYFNGETIGASFEHAVEWMKANEDLVPSIEKTLN